MPRHFGHRTDMKTITATRARANLYRLMEEAAVTSEPA